MKHDDAPLTPSLSHKGRGRFLGFLLLAATAHSTEPAVSTSSLVDVPSVTIVAVGDMRLDGPVGKVIAEGGAAAPLEGIADALRGDILFGNLECPVTTRGSKVEKTWNFKAPPRNLAAISSFTVVSVANNHAFDYGPQGLLDTLRYLRKARIKALGAGRDRDEAEKLVVIKRRGLKIGWLAFTSTFPKEAWAKPGRPGVAYSDFKRFPEVIREARPKCDVLLVSFHGGTELDEEPNELQKAFARDAIDAGADAVIGHHPHVLQPIQVYKGKPIFYSLGNFLFVSPSPLTRWTAAARLVVDKNGVRSIAVEPIAIGAGRLSSAPEEGRTEVRRRLDKYGALSALEPR